jgi:transposase
LRTDLLPEAWIAPGEIRDLRALLRHRASLVRFSTALKNRIHAVLADRGIRRDVVDLWTAAGRAWLGSTDLPRVQQTIVNDCLGLIDAVAVPIASLGREIRALAKPDARVKALQQLPELVASPP